MKPLITTTLLFIATLLHGQQDTIQLDTTLSAQVREIVEVLNKNAQAVQEYSTKMRELNLIIIAAKGAEEKQFKGWAKDFKAIIFENSKEKK